MRKPRRLCLKEAENLLNRLSGRRFTSVLQSQPVYKLLLGDGVKRVALFTGSFRNFSFQQIQNKDKKGNCWKLIMLFLFVCLVGGVQKHDSL